MKVSNENKDKYCTEFLGKSVFVDSTQYSYNEIIGLQRATYYDYDLKHEHYLFKRNAHEITLGCINYRNRNEIIFNVEDVSVYIDQKLKYWKAKRENQNLNLAGAEIEYDTTMMYLIWNDIHFEVLPADVLQGTLIRPYKLTTSKFSAACTHIENTCGRWMNCTVKGPYNFTKEGIQLLKDDISEMVKEISK